MILPRQVRSGRDAVQRLRAARRRAEAGDHFVEDRAALPCASQSSRSPRRKPSAGGTTPMLPAIGSTISAAICRGSPSNSALDRRRGRCSVAISVSAAAAACHARARRHAERQRAGAGLHEERVGVAVIAALELDDLVALRVRPRHAHGAHRRFGAGADEAHALERRHQPSARARRARPRAGWARRSSCRVAPPRRAP